MSESGIGPGAGSEAPQGDRPPRDDRPPREDRPREERGGRFGRGPGGRDRERGPMSVKARLRAKARKKARKAQKKKGGFLRKKVCRFCADASVLIDYKDPKGLRYFMTETGKLIPQRISGNCAKHQRQVAVAIKRSRQLALMPFASHHGT